MTKSRIKFLLSKYGSYGNFRKNLKLAAFLFCLEYYENYTYLSYHVIVENAKNTGYNIDENVMRFAKFFSSTNLEELKNSTEGDEEIMSAYKKVEELVQDENFIGYYDAAERFEREKQGYKATGIREGFEHGLEQGQKVIIQKFLNANMSIEEISKITELSIEDIQKLLEK